MKVTRRDLAVALASTAVASAQAPAVPATPEAELQAARDQVKAMSDRLRGQKVPMSVEPAFVFHV